MDGDTDEATDVNDESSAPGKVEEPGTSSTSGRGWVRLKQLAEDKTYLDPAKAAHVYSNYDPERKRLDRVKTDTQLQLLVQDEDEKESLVGSRPLSIADSAESGTRQRVSIVDPESDPTGEVSNVLVDSCAICRHLFNNYATEDELESQSNTDPKHFRAPFAQFWREKEMAEDKQATQTRPALCNFHALYKERHDFLVYVLEQRRQNRRLSPAELTAMQNIDNAGTHDKGYLKDVQIVVEEHFKIAREAVMRRLATEARQLRSHWETAKDQQDQEIVDALSGMQKRHQTEIEEQRGNIRSALGRKKLHYSSELLSSFENEKHLLEKRDWAKACNEAKRATQIEKQARRQFQMGIHEEAKRREDWVKTLLERQKNSRIDRCTLRRQMGAVERAADGEKLYRRLEQTTHRLNKAHAVEMRKIQVFFTEHCSRMSHIVERTARGTGVLQEKEHRKSLYVTPVRVPFRPDEAGPGDNATQRPKFEKSDSATINSTQRPKSAGGKVNMARSLPGEFASKILSEEMRISMHRKLAAASRLRKSGSAPGGGVTAAAPKIPHGGVSAARPPSANSRLRNPVEQRMVGHLRKRPSSAGALGRQPWAQETGEKGVYGTQWPQTREALQCDFCGKRGGKPCKLPASAAEGDDDIVCVGCSWECVRQWNAKLSPPFLKEKRADLIQDLCGKEALAAADASLEPPLAPRL